MGTDTSFQVVRGPWHRHQTWEQTPVSRSSEGHGRITKGCVSENPKKTQNIMDTPKDRKEPKTKEPLVYGNIVHEALKQGTGMWLWR